MSPQLWRDQPPIGPMPLKVSDTQIWGLCRVSTIGHPEVHLSRNSASWGNKEHALISQKSEQESAHPTFTEGVLCADTVSSTGHPRISPPAGGLPSLPWCRRWKTGLAWGHEQLRPLGWEMVVPHPGPGPSSCRTGPVTLAMPGFSSNCLPNSFAEKHF